jgi:hypothetical protein
MRSTVGLATLEDDSTHISTVCRTEGGVAVVVRGSHETQTLRSRERPDTGTQLHVPC